MSSPIKFSPRQQEIIDLILEGKKVNEIAEITFTSGSTIESHIKEIRKKIGVITYADLIEKLRK